MSAEQPFYAGVLSRANPDALVDWFARAAWQYPEYAQLWFRDQGENTYSLWMFRDGVLRRLTPEPRSVEAEIFPEDELCRLRLGDRSDRTFLADLVTRCVPNSAPLVSAIKRARFDRREERPRLREPASVILLDELPGDDWDVDGWYVEVWRRVGAGVVWVDARSGAREASVFIAVREEFRSLPTVQLLLERLLALAKAGGMRELVAEAPQHDEWLARAYRQAGFSQTARDSVLELRKQI